MYYKYRLGPLRNLSTASGSSDSGGTVGPSYSQAVGLTFHYCNYNCLLKPAAQAHVGKIKLFINCFSNPTITCATENRNTQLREAAIFLFPSSSVTLSYFILAFSHARVFGKTLTYEIIISYSHTEWYLRFSDSATTSAQCVFGAKKYKYLCAS